MNILITGASGLIGTALQQHFMMQGHIVKPLQRGIDSSGDQLYWDIPSGTIDLKGFKPDAVIHLAGENIAAARWSKTRKDKILNSRVQGTRLLVKHLLAMEHKPKVLLSASAIGFYGLRDSECLDEQSHSGSGDFVSDVCLAWEAETVAAQQAGIRVVSMRTGVVLAKHDGALAKMLPAFKLGLGGVLGSGQQYMSWVSLDDVVGMIDFIMQNEHLQGAVNLTAPNPVNNQVFTKALGAALHRPTIFPMPAFVAKLLFGEMAQELLLGGARVIPKKLDDAGYCFQHDTIDDALIAILKRNT